MHSHQEDIHIKKKRVGKACDSCRIKKTKCDGKKPCNRCIIDNKICVFTEKKKLKEKNHPSGYIELLETRLDILTKSFEKLIELSRPHLQFIQDIVEEQKRHIEMDDISSMEEDDEDVYDEDGNHIIADEDVVPINKVVSYLIQHQGLLSNLPMEWEEGAIIAANFEPGKNLSTSAKLFAEHKGNGSSVSSPVIKNEPSSPNVSPRMKPKSKPKKSKQTEGVNAFTSILIDNSNLVMNSRQQELSGSDFESDSNANPFQNVNYQGSESPSNEFQTGPYRTASLFSSDSPVLTKTTSLSSLTNTYESHSIASPPPLPIQLSASPIPSPMFLNKPTPNLQKKRSYSNNGVHKPQHHTHTHKSIDHTKRDSGSSTTSSMIDTPNQAPNLFSPMEDPSLNNYMDDKVFSMNTQPVIASPPEMMFGQYQTFDILANENNFDTFMNNGQF